MTQRELRKKHPKFIYESFRYSLKKTGLLIEFKFKLEPDIVFTPSIFIENVTPHLVRKIPKNVLDNFVFHMGLAEIPSYWKCALSPVIEVQAAQLDNLQKNWWRKLLINGLAEFFYINGINPRKTTFRITSASEPTVKASERERKKKRENTFLMPVGGGKDSLVALKLMQGMRKKVGTMVLGDVKASYNLIKSLSLKPPIKIRRTIDKKLLDLNKRGYLNGHTPFSAYLAFLSVFCAELFGYDTVVVANERSANEPSLILKGWTINPHTKRGVMANIQGIQAPRSGVGVNHQYSKSYEFEKDFRTYIKKYLTRNVDYFSILRPLYELQIAKLAAGFPKNIKVTRSCNVKLKENSWCGKCAKCFSVFLLLYPFLAVDQLEKLFGKNLFKDRKLWKFVPELIGIKNKKPFDCIATRRENIAALIMSYEKCEAEGRTVPYILRRFHKTLEPSTKMSKKSIDKIMYSWDKKNFLPGDIKTKLLSLIKTGAL